MGARSVSKQRRAAAERIREMQAQQATAERRRRTLIVGGVVLVVIAIVVGIGIAVSSRQDPVDTSGPLVVPPGVTDHNGVYRGSASAPVAVTVYEDFQCPVCKEFEGLVGPTLLDDINAGTIRLEYRPIAFLDRSSTTNYSSRSLATAACALADGGPTVFAKLHDLLYANQPEEGSAGLSDERLADLAQEAGADKAAVAKCQASGTYNRWTAKVTDQASKDGITGTPTYFVDGKQVTFVQGEDPKTTLTHLIDAADQ
jgi:protein-disulfide isomerase